MLHTVVIASGNPGKLKEFRALFAGSACEVVAQGDYDVPEADETGLSFIENAILKARNAAAHSGLPAIADDSGLAVDYLNGAPGIYSARYSVGDARFGDISAHANDSIDAANNRKLLAELDGVADDKRGARFICALAFIAHAHDPTPVVCSAEWRGRIMESAQGSAGFGYDPLFYLPEFGCSSASLSPATKNANSHRGKAMRAMQQLLAQQNLLP